MRRGTFFVLLMTVSFQLLVAQDKPLPVFHFNHLTTADGLPTNEIRSYTVTDRQGLIWIGTENGLARYDGYTCRVYRHKAGDSGSLPANSVMELLLDSRGLLWIGTDLHGLSLYDASNDRILNFRPQGKDSVLRRLKAVLMIHEDPAGNIWGSSIDNTVIMADMSTAGDSIAESVAARVRFLILHLEGPSESVYLGDWDRETMLFGTARGFHTYNRTTRQISRLSLPHTAGVNVDTVKIAAFCWESSELLWIATRSYGLYLFDRSRMSLTAFHKRPAGGKNPRDDRIEDAVIDRNGRLWIATSNTLDLFDLPSRAYKEYLTYPSVAPQSPYHVNVDRMGRLWVSTMNDGLYFLTPQSLRFPHYALRGADGRPRAMETIDEAGGESYWVATEGNVVRLRLSDLTTLESVDLFKGARPRYLRAGVLDSYRDRHGTIWYGTWGLGLYMYNPRTGRVVSFRSSRQGIGLVNNDDVCQSIAPGTGDSLWIAGNRDGLLQFDTRTCRFSRRTTVGGLTLPSVTHVETDGRGKLWISDEQQGVIVLDQTSGAVNQFTNDPNDPASLSQDIVRFTYKDPDGKMWVGARDLNLWNADSRSFTRFPNNAFSGSDFVMPMGTDPQGRLWVSYYERGVGLLFPGFGPFLNLDRTDGLCGDIYSMYLCRDGRVLLLGSAGMNLIRPESLSTVQSSPPLAITRVSINDSITVSHQKNADPTLQLPHDQNVLEFEFAASDPGAGQLIEYRYRLEGLEGSWVHPGSRRYVRYPGLPPGSYVFRVKAISSSGRWHDQEISLGVTIAPPWWRSPWAYAAYGIFVVGIILGSYRMRMRQIQLKQQAEMEHFQAERLAEVDRLKSRFFTNISHEFRTPLTLILGLNEQLHEFIHEPALLRHKQHLIAENAQKLHALVGQLLDFARLESGIMKLQVSRTDVLTFLRRTVMSFESWAERKRITLEFRSNADSLEVFFDSDKLEKIVNNLMSNAVKFTAEGGRVTVSVTQSGVLSSESRMPDRPDPGRSAGQTSDRDQQPAGLRITVSDTGPGIPPEYLPRIFDRFFRGDETHTIEGTGIGLAMTKELVELHRGSIRVESVLGNGSVFTVEIPAGKSAYQEKEIVEAPLQLEMPTVSPIGAPVERLAAIPGPESAEGRPVVLVVEDNSDLRQYIREYLKNQYLVSEAPDGKAGYDLAVESVPDIVISDVMMPRMDGMELCRALKQDVRTSHIPVILLTARAGTESKIEGLDTGADDYVTKPFDAKELGARVRNLIEQRRELRKKFSAGVVLKPGEVAVTSLDNALLRKAMMIVERHMGDERFGVDDLAREILLSRATLNRKLQALTNLSPAEFIRYLRLQRARELLENHAGSVAEIAFQVGFGSPSHFSAAFHGRFGIPPSEVPPRIG